MSYTLAFTAEAQEGLRQLEPALQEIVLDIIDDVAIRPLAMRQRSVRGVTVYDFDRDMAGVRHTVFVILDVSHARHEVTVLRIGHASDPINN